jgi:hypothetical protein
MGVPLTFLPIVHIVFDIASGYLSAISTPRDRSPAMWSTGAAKEALIVYTKQVLAALVGAGWGSNKKVFPPGALSVGVRSPA